MKKKLVSLLLATTMVAGLVGCGSSNGGSTDTSATTDSKTETSTTTADTSASGDTASTETADIDTSEHVVITYMTTGGSDEGNGNADMLAKLNEILTEKVNAELKIYHIDWTNYLSVYNLTLAQMDGSVDLVGTASDWLDAWPNAKNGAFLELSEDMLKTYAPKTWESVPAEHWDLCKYNGEIYLMPEDNYAQWTNHGFAYRLDWAKEAGLTDGVKSWEDLTTYFKYVKETYGNDLKYLWDSDGTQFNTMVGGWINSHSNYVAIDGLNAGAMWGGSKDDLYTVYSPYMTDTDSLVEYAKLMKEWNELGVFPTNVLNNTSAQNRDEYRVGQVAVEQHHTQTWTDLCSHTSSNTIYDTDEDAETGFFYFGEETGNVVALSITHGAMAVSAGSKNPERALMVYDLLRNDPECYRLFNYGIEGVQYAIDENGMKYTPDTYDSTTEEIQTNFWWGRNDDLELKDATKNWDAIDKLYAEYDSLKIDYPYGQFIPDVDDIQGKIDNVSSVQEEYMKQISFGLYSGSAEDIVAEYQAALEKAGINDVTAALQSQIDALYK